MSRPVDAERHQQRRPHIIGAAYEAFADLGYDRASTAEICRRASVSSGTFFHYFPTKASVMVALIEHGAAEQQQAFDEAAALPDALAALHRGVTHLVADGDPRAGGFARTVISVAHLPELAPALADDERRTHAWVSALLERAQIEGSARTDLSAPVLAGWVTALIDGYFTQLAAPGFDAAAGQDQVHDLIDRCVR